jgi:hypothetical protein
VLVLAGFIWIVVGGLGTLGMMGVFAREVWCDRQRRRARQEGRS